MDQTAAPVAESWLIVIQPDGLVEAVAGGAPPSWVGQSVDLALESYPTLLAALPELIDSHIAGTCIHRARARIRVGEREIEVELLLLEAVPIRKALVPIESLVMRTIDVFLGQARSAEIELALRFAEDLPSVALIDGEKTAWALATVVGGALRHVCKVDPSQRSPRISVSTDWDGTTDEIVLTVSDNGPGIPSDRVKWLFDRDPSTGRAAGLALVMVRDVVVAHRGSIDVASDPETGTTFALRFPRRIRAPRSS